MLGLLAKKLDRDIPKGSYSKKNKTKTLKAFNSIPMTSKQCAMNEKRT